MKKRKIHRKRKRLINKEEQNNNKIIWVKKEVEEMGIKVAVVV